MPKTNTLEVAVAARIPKEIADRLPPAGVHGLRAKWIRQAILEKMQRESKET